MCRRLITRKIVFLAGWMVLALAIVRCGDPENTPCAKDADCKGDRICVDGTCRASSQCPSSCTNNSDCANCPADRRSCVNSKCAATPIAVEEVTIQPGTFTMGSPANEMGRDDDETTYEVTLSHKFALWKYEVTQGDFQKLMGYNPSSFSNCGSSCPVENISWHEAAAFTNALSRNQGLEECYNCSLTVASDQKSWNCTVKQAYQGNKYYTCKGYRLPTEAEWEYAYRAGTTTAFYNGDLTKKACEMDPKLDEIGWYCGNANKSVHPVGQKQPNAWGLHDMAGNVYERVYDWYNETYPKQSVTDPVGPDTGTARVHRGGSWSYNAEHTRAADRSNAPPHYRAHDVGIRPARTVFE